MPRAGLSPAAVTELALAVVDEGGAAGFAGLTLAAVAAKAGVAVPSLYKHVGSLGALRRAVAIVSVAGLTEAMAGAAVTAMGSPAPRGAAAGQGGAGQGAGPDGAEALRAVAGAARGFAHEHPARYFAAQVAPDLDDASDGDLAAVGAAAVETIAGALSGFDMPPRLTVDAVRIVRSTVHGFVALELGGGFGLPDDLDVSFGLLVDTLVAGMERLASSDR